ncbi:GIN domain-containing protein [Cytophaga aurantiaca]|uniref:GIN domain-containing protein n=1 Tax=Cytophaga aurantiaca TaxID=29530 RepID=UPI00037314AC|nr:DUF2807 domain-containing protein [Cytophaga aurantiaca]
MKKSCLVFLSFLISAFSLHVFASDYEERKLGSFHNITVEDGITVVLIHSDKNKAFVKVEDVDLSDVITDLSVFSLTVKMKKYVANASVTVEIYYTDALDEITTEAGVNLLSEGKVYTDKLTINARFGGEIRIEIDAKEIEIQAGGATITVTGKVKDLEIHALKNALVDCSNLNYQSKDVFNSGGVVKLKE